MEKTTSRDFFQKVGCIIIHAQITTDALELNQAFLSIKPLI